MAPAQRRHRVRVATARTARTIELRTDPFDGPMVGRIDLPNTGSRQSWTTLHTQVEVAGRHRLFILFARQRQPRHQPELVDLHPVTRRSASVRFEKHSWMIRRPSRRTCPLTVPPTESRCSPAGSCAVRARTANARTVSRSPRPARRSRSTTSYCGYWSAMTYGRNRKGPPAT
ncbi:carbohydrate-binding protein [Kribbella aluminosa]|uniref:carbohydrate-binding protein n=1 Tax=Kribbella aluminosa TaxID=416017 RepID=UPI003556E2EA